MVDGLLQIDIDRLRVSLGARREQILQRDAAASVSDFSIIRTRVHNGLINYLINDLINDLIEEFFCDKLKSNPVDNSTNLRKGESRERQIAATV